MSQKPTVNPKETITVGTTAPNVKACYVTASERRTLNTDHNEGEMVPAFKKDRKCLVLGFTKIDVLHEHYIDKVAYMTSDDYLDSKEGLLGWKKQSVFDRDQCQFTTTVLYKGFDYSEFEQLSYYLTKPDEVCVRTLFVFCFHFMFSFVNMCCFNRSYHCLSQQQI